MVVNSPIVGWRRRASRYLLQGLQCTTCALMFYPDKFLCPCGSQVFKPVTFSGNGTLVSFTYITVPPHDYIRTAPYIIGLVKLAEGPSVLTQITDCLLSDLSIGMPVTSVFRKYSGAGEKGIIEYGIKFTPRK